MLCPISTQRGIRLEMEENNIYKPVHSIL